VDPGPGRLVHPVRGADRRRRVERGEPHRRARRPRNGTRDRRRRSRSASSPTSPATRGSPSTCSS
jgi:hypothetical protein